MRYFRKAPDRPHGRGQREKAALAMALAEATAAAAQSIAQTGDPAAWMIAVMNTVGLPIETRLDGGRRALSG